jgi:hypothetical protein
MGVGGQRHAPAALPPEMTRYPWYRRLGRPQGRSGRVPKISPPPGFDPRTAQPVASRYTDYANPAHHDQFLSELLNILLEYFSICTYLLVFAILYFSFMIHVVISYRFCLC